MLTAKNLARSAGLIAPASKLFVFGSSLASDTVFHACAPLTWMERGRDGSPESSRRSQSGTTYSHKVHQV